MVTELTTPLQFTVFFAVALAATLSTIAVFHGPRVALMVCGQFFALMAAFSIWYLVVANFL